MAFFGVLAVSCFPPWAAIESLGSPVEELLIVIIQFLFETVLESLIYWPFESAADQLFGSRPARRSSRGSVPLIAGIGGGVLGGISLVVWPHTWLHSPLLRIANAVSAPLISAGSAWLIASHRARHRDRSSPRDQALFGFTFTLAFVLVRFAWGQR